MTDETTGANGRKIFDDELGRRRCTATARSGDRCRNRPIVGGAVCRFHGGAAPQVRKSAHRRLMESVDPALAKLEALLDIPLAEWRMLHPGTDNSGPVYRPVGISHADALRAIEAILDRTGYPRRQELDLGDARTRVLERLQAEALETVEG